MAAPEVSHGRGGAGNINPDDTKYIDGEIVRAGTPGSQGAGAFSTGRGGKSKLPGFSCNMLRGQLCTFPCCRAFHATLGAYR